MRYKKPQLREETNFTSTEEVEAALDEVGDVTIDEIVDENTLIVSGGTGTWRVSLERLGHNMEIGEEIAFEDASVFPEDLVVAEVTPLSEPPRSSRVGLPPDRRR